jgi:hypothetical protein
MQVFAETEKAVGHRILAYQTRCGCCRWGEEFLRGMAPYGPPEKAREYLNIRISSWQTKRGIHFPS